jgi:hypothetical protein
MRAAYIAAAGVLTAFASAHAADIREFSVATLERLGNELSHRDEIAAKASDLVLAQHPEFKKISPQGWITDLQHDGDLVYFIAERNTGLSAAYKVTFPHRGSPRVEDIHNTNLPAKIAVRYKARQTAMRAASNKLNTAYGASYNFEILNDPDGSGFLVYALAAFTKTDAVYTGGHIRVTVSADGLTAERIDDLSHGIIRQTGDPGKEMVAIATAQVVDAKYPVETWLYSSHLYHLPMYVATKDGSMWGVANGRIVRVDAKGPKNHLDILNGKAPEVPQR